MMIRFAITLSKTSELIVTKRKILLTQSRALQKLLQVFLFLYFWYLFRNQKQHLVTGILTLMRLTEISNRKHLQKSNNCLKLHLKDNMPLYKLRTYFSKFSAPIFPSQDKIYTFSSDRSKEVKNYTQHTIKLSWLYSYRQV